MRYLSPARAVGIGSACSLAAVFVASLVSFVRDPARAAAVVEVLRLRPAKPIALAAGAAESVVAATLVASPSVGGRVAAGYLAGVTGTLALAKARGIDIEDCGCFAREHPVDVAFFVRNASLVGLGLVCSRFSPRGSPVVAAAMATVAAAVTTVTALNRMSSTVD